MSEGKPRKKRLNKKSRALRKRSKKGTIRGQIKYPWGSVARATVTAGGKSTISDATGKYEMSMLDPGEYKVGVKPPFPGYEANPQSVSLASDETRVVNFYLDFERAVVLGFVYGADGKPVPDAKLSGIRSGKDVETAVTDEKGYFRFQNASPGLQSIRVNALGYVGQNRDFNAKKDEVTELDFHLEPGVYRIFGTLSDEEDKPLSGEIVLSSGSGIIIQKTESKGENGYYEVAVNAGTYNLLASKAGYESKGWRGHISADQSLDFKLKLSPPLQDSIPSDRLTTQNIDPHRPRARW